jgi:hypothetical protein
MDNNYNGYMVREFKPSNDHFWMLLGSYFLSYFVIFPILGIRESYKELKRFNAATSDLTISQIKEKYGYRRPLIYLSFSIHIISAMSMVINGNILFDILF